jgi:4'-phosphopantetheinyl transferase
MPTYKTKTMVEVFAIKILNEEGYLEVREKLFALLPESQVSNIQRFKRLADEQRSLLGEILSRHILGEKTGINIHDLKITKSVKGKPRLKNQQGIFYNISHSGHWVVAAIGDNPVGIDVEEIKEPVYRIAERYFSRVELEALNQLSDAQKQERFFDLWTLKESYLKMLGKGLTRSLGSFSIVKKINGYQLIEHNNAKENVFFIQYTIEPHYKLSVCSTVNNFASQIRFTAINEILINTMNGK